MKIEAIWPDAEVRVDGLRLRAKAGIVGTILGSMKAGQQIGYLPDVQVVADGYVWLCVSTNGTTTAWAARNQIDGSTFINTNPTPTPIPAPQPQPAPAPTGRLFPMGFHLLPGAPIGKVLDAVRGLRASGIHLPFVVTNEHGWCGAIKDADPESVVAFRWLGKEEDNYPTDNGRILSGEERFTQWWPQLQAARADYYQFDNEWNHPDIPRMVQYFIELMAACSKRGIKALIGNIAVGHPEPYDYPALVPMLKLAQDLGHAFSYHMYSNEPSDAMDDPGHYYTLRWEDMTRGFPNLKIINGEAGPKDAVYRSPEHAMKLFGECIDVLKPYAGRVTGCYWVLGGQFDPRWAKGNVEAALDSLVELIYQKK